MSEFHRLDASTDARFLRARVADPLTGVAFKPTNVVVRCATCGQVSLRETWEALGGCPNGHDTPATWDAEAALGAGDGAAAPPPAVRPAPVVEDRGRPGWLTGLLIALGVAVLVVAGVVVAGLLRGDEEPVEVVEDAPTQPTGPRAVVAVAGTVEGSLAGGDFQDPDLRYRDLYSFAADSSGRVLSFSLSAEDFYPDLYVETPEGDRVDAETVSEEDGVRTVAVPGLRGPGLYRIHVTSRQPEETGAYTLQIRQEDPVRPLTAGAAAFEAELGAFSQQVEGFYRDTYRFRGVAGREHAITVRSSAFAPTVAVTGAGGAVRGESGRAGGSTTFTFTPEQDGPLTLVVSSQSQGQRGAYTVQLTVEAAPEAPTTTLLPLPANGSPVSDSLAAGDTRTYGVQGRIGDRIRLEVRAEGFTPSLTLVGPDGSRTPAVPDADRARIRTTLPSQGTYRVIVGAPGGSGQFRLTLEQEAAVTSEDIPRLPGVGAPPTEPTPPPSGDYRPQPIGDGQ